MDNWNGPGAASMDTWNLDCIKVVPSEELWDPHHLEAQCEGRPEGCHWIHDLIVICFSLSLCLSFSHIFLTPLFYFFLSFYLTFTFK